MTVVPAGTIDSHLHLWDLGRSAYTWLTPDHGPLFTTIGSDEAVFPLRGAGVNAVVLVQADDADADTDFLLEVAHGCEWVAGVVGWIPLDDPVRAERRIEELVVDPAFRGVRHLTHEDPRSDFLSLPSVRRSLSTLAAHGATLDVPDAWPRHLSEIVDLADAIPELTVVVDHLGKPPGDLDGLAQWHAQFVAVAQRPNTVTKFSGLQHLDDSTRRRVWDVALQEFGPTRMLWGSDWPMTLTGGGYEATVAQTLPLICELSSAEQAAVLHRTASGVYRLSQPGH